jgi:hypothetical protein
MNVRLAAVMSVLVAVGCGESKVMWLLDSSSVSFDESKCTDDAEFRSLWPAATVNTDAGAVYLAYEYSSDRTTARGMKCSSYKVDDCTASSDLPVFKAKGSTLTRKYSFGFDANGDGSCLATGNVAFTLADRGDTMNVGEKTVLTLTGACDTVESDARDRSSNGLGINGCTFTRYLVGTRN